MDTFGLTVSQLREARALAIMEATSAKQKDLLGSRTLTVYEALKLAPKSLRSRLGATNSPKTQN